MVSAENLENQNNIDNGNGERPSPSEMAKIMQILDIKQDAFDLPEFEAVDYLNDLFPDEASLDNISDVLDRFQKEIHNIDVQLNECFKEVVAENDNQTENYELLSQDLDTLDHSIESTLNKALNATETVDKTMMEVQSYNLAKSNIEKSLNVLNGLLYMFESSKKLENLIQSEDFNQIYTILSGYDAVANSTENLHQYEKVKRLLDNMEHLKLNLKSVLEIEFGKIFTDGPYQDDKKSGIFRCIGIMDQDFQTKIKEKLFNHLQNQFIAIFNSLRNPSDWSDLSYAIDDLQQWLVTAISKLNALKKCNMPAKWNMEHQITGLFASNLLNLYENSLKSFTTFSFESFRNVCVKITKLDEVYKPIQNLKPQCENFMQLNSSIYCKFEDHYSAEFKQLMVKWQASSVESKKSDVVTVFPAAKQLFQFFKTIASNSIYFDKDSFAPKIFELFTKFLGSFIADFFSRPLEKISGAVRKTAYNSQSNYVPPMASANAENLRSLKNLFSKFSLLGSRASSHDMGSAESDSFEEVLKEIACYLVSVDFCFDTIEHLESFLRFSTSVENISKIDFTPQKKIFIELINESINIIIQLSISECSSAFQMFSSRTWYNDHNEIESTTTTSKYAQVLAAKLKSISSSTRLALDLCRDHLITICKALVTQITNTLLFICLNNHKGLSLKTSQGQQLTNDVRLICSFLSNLPVLNSKLTINQIPSVYTQHVDQVLKRFMSLLKFMLIEVDDNSKFGLASNYKKIVGMKIEPNLIVDILKWKGITRESELSEVMQLIKDQ